MTRQARGSALLVGLLLLSLIALLGLAGGSSAQVELRLARNERFRENAASAASAGIEIAIRHVTDPDSASLPARLQASLPGTMDDYQADIRLLGMEGLPQAPGASLAGAHFEIVATGRSGRGAVDRQRAIVMHTIAAPGMVGPDCEPVAPGVACAAAGDWRMLSWQRLPAP